MKIMIEKRNKKGELEKQLIFQGTKIEFEYLENKGWIKKCLK